MSCNKTSQKRPSRKAQKDIGTGSLDTTADFGSHFPTKKRKGNGKARKRKASRESRQEARADRFRQLKFAAPLVAEHTGLLRMWSCRENAQSVQAGVDVVTSQYGKDPEQFGHYEGVQTCGYLKYCPCCARRIAETRRAEMNLLLTWARAAGYTVQMMTLTARHGIEDPLLDLVMGIKAAKSALHRHRTWRTKIAPYIVGTVTGFEIVGGGPAGWHPHFHVIVITKVPVDLDQLKDPWLASLRGKGLDGTGAGWKVQDASHAGDYVAKWGMGEEMTLTDKKRGRKGGLSPFQLLASACQEGDARSLALWIEYLKATPQIQVLRWSNGLKALVGVDEKSDEEAARDDKQEEQVETGRANIPNGPWRKVPGRKGRRDRRAEILNIAERDGAEAAAAAAIAGGDLDAEELRDLLEDPDPQVIDDHERDPPVDPDHEAQVEEFLTDVQELYKPKPGGLAALALAAIPPPDSGFSPGADIYQERHMENDNG